VKSISIERSPEELSAIAQYVMPEFPAQKADLAFLFGTRHGVDEFCVEAYSLWQRNMFTKLIISGGPTLGETKAEAIVIAEVLTKMGLPQEVLILETAAMNTGENVLLSRQKIAETIGLENIRSILVIGKICSMRRYLMTLERHWPGLVKSACPVNYFDVEKECWHEHPEFRRRVIDEFEKIPRYLQADFLRELPVPNPGSKRPL
jgi:uncharacterized SAM-binding protein YcdF (DUF218 family)